MPPLPPPPTSSSWTSSLPALYAAECDDFSPATASRPGHRLRHSPPPRRPSPTVPDRHPWIMFNDDPFEHQIASIMSKLPVVPPAHPARESAQRRAALILHHLRAPQAPPQPQVPSGWHEVAGVSEVQYGGVAAPMWSAAGQAYPGLLARAATGSAVPAASSASSSGRTASRRVWRL